MKSFKSIFSSVVLLAAVLTSNAQENTINFSYDEGGNTVERKLQVVIGGRIGQFNTPNDSLKPYFPNGFKVYPNPTNTNLNVEGELPEGITEAQMTLFNINGQALKKEYYHGQPKAINVSDVKSGMYLLEIKYSEKKRGTYKIIVTN